MGLTLFISEKPSLGRTVAKALGIVKDFKTHVICENDCVVAFAQGHLYEYLTPNEYDERFKQWRREDLPLPIPTLRLKPQEKTKYRLDVIEDFLKKATRVIHVGDPDREGQRIVDDILEQAGYTGKVERLWNTDQSERGMKKTMEEFARGFPDNSLPVYHNRSLAAKARAEMDWRLGMNFSRAIGCRLNKFGIRKVVSYGRFQSTILALIVRRENERRNFKPKKFYTPKALVAGVETEFVHDQETFPDGYDSEGYLVNKDVANKICALVRGKDGEVVEFERKKGSKAPPLPYDLSRLIQDANNRYKISAKETNDIAQSLYDKGITTYPRVDCRFLPDGHYADAPRILAALSGITGAEGANPKIKGKCFNSKKTDEAAHHAIVPTGDDWHELTGKEKQIFELVATAYILQFYPDQEYETQRLTVRFPGPPKTDWKATGRKVLSPGWTSVVRDDEESGAELPQFTKGQKIFCDSATLNEGETKKPPAFTEASIINAMENVDRYEPNPEYKKLLKEAKGIGTGATRGGILDLMQRRDYIVIQKGVISPTKFGEELVSYIPESLYSPALTAIMEGRLEDIAQGRITPEDFLSEIEKDMPAYLDEIDHVDVKADPSSSQICPVCNTGQAVRLHSKKTDRYFWKCQNEACGKFFDDNNGRLVVPQKCPKCGEVSVSRFMSKKTGKPFWKCMNEACGVFYNDNNGKMCVPEKCPACGAIAVSRRESMKKPGSFYWKCDNCGKFFYDDNGKLGAMREERVSAECPVCHEHEAVRYQSKKNPGSYIWKCEKCGWLDDDNGKPGLRAIDKLPQAKCPECGGLCVQFKSSKTGNPFWKCQADESHAFADKDGQPGERFGSFDKTGLEKAKCPHCKGDAYKRQAKSGTSWYWRCDKCGNMRDDNGKPGDLFDSKPKGKK